MRGSCALAACGVAALLGAASPAAAATLDLSIGWVSAEGEFEGDEEVTLTRLPIELVFGRNNGRFTIVLPFTRIDRTGDVTWSADGPILLSVNSPSGPPFQTSAVGGSESGLGDIILRDETYLVRAGGGRRPQLSWILEAKVQTADEKEGLGTGKSDYKVGLSYVQPLGRVVQILGDASYTFMGSPGGLDFDDRVALGAGFALVSNRTTWRVTVENITPPLDEVPRFDGAGAQVGVLEVDDRRVARLELIGRSRRGGSVGVAASWGLTDSSEDFGFMLRLSSASR